jgi:hypothetical protein
MLIVEGHEGTLVRVEKLVAILARCEHNQAALTAIDANLALWERLTKADPGKKVRKPAAQPRRKAA